MMILSLDNLASRYHCLPSEAMSRGSTFDLYVLDVSARWARHQQDVADGKVPEKKALTVEQMKAMIASARSENAVKEN